MNRAYRLVWNACRTAYVPVPESARSVGAAAAIAAAMVTLLAGNAYALPSGGQLSFGAGTISQDGSAMTIRQSSQNLGLNWQSFGIGNRESVTFLQPSASSIALNRVLGRDPSAIYGRLSANGRVWLLNPNGVLFGSGAQVNVGGLVASTLGLSDSDFLAGKRSFSGSGGTVSNSGTLTAADRGYIALLGGQVDNRGVIQARLGTVALAAGKQVTLDFAGDRLVSLQVDKGAVDALVSNKQLIRADGGLVSMTARGADAMLNAVVNNQGVIEARTVDTRAGTIRLLGDTVKVAGTLDASAPNRGPGGFIETSGRSVKVADAAKITTTSAAPGATGTWLIDPADFTIAATGGDITGAALAVRLATNNVTILSSEGSASGPGDVRVNDQVTWGSANNLTLSALHDVQVARPLVAIGRGSVTLRADNTGACVAGAVNCGTVRFVDRGQVTLNGGALNIYYNPTGNNLPADVNGNGPSYATPTDYSGNAILNKGSTLTAWMLVNDANQLQAIDTNLSGTYALGRDIDASVTAAWNPQPGDPNAGFLPIGDPDHPFTGRLDGQGHVIAGLVMNNFWWSATPSENVGLFDSTTGLLENLGLVGSSVRGYGRYIGTLAGYNGGTIRNVFAQTKVFSMTQAGGLVGHNTGTITHASVDGDVYGLNEAGGLVQHNAGILTDVRSTASVDAEEDMAISGGLVATNVGTIRDADASGSVVSWWTAGGLVGSNTGTVENAVASGDVRGYKGPVGGLVGDNGGMLRRVEARGGVTGGREHLGGLVGRNTGEIAFASSSGTVTANSAQGETESTGGLVGYNSGTISDAHASGNVLNGLTTDRARYNGGLVGHNAGIIRNSDASGDVSGGDVNGGLVAFNSGIIRYGRASGNVSGGKNVGGLVGINDGTVDLSYATGDVTGHTAVGGLVGDNAGGAAVVSNSYATGDVAGEYAVGGLAGHNAGSIKSSRASGDVAGLGSIQEALGGLVGANEGCIDGSYAEGEAYGRFNVGGLAGFNHGTISRSHASGNTGGDVVGGLVGSNAGSISRSYATGFAGGDKAGGLVGVNTGTVASSYASGNAGAVRYGGGLIGFNLGKVMDSHASGDVSGGDFIGGLVGANEGAIARSYATGSAWTYGYFTGGLVGMNTGTIDRTYATGAVSGNFVVGGLVGENSGEAAKISNSYATGSVGGDNQVGGLVGRNSGLIKSSHASGKVADIPGGFIHETMGGLVGTNEGTIDASYAEGDVSGWFTVGGLVGFNQGTISRSHASGNVGGDGVGGLVGHNRGSISDSYATGRASGDFSGGLVGANDGSIARSYASGTVFGSHDVGGLVGINGGLVLDSHAAGEISGSHSTGGLAGTNNGAIARSYATGNVSGLGGERVGGLVGQNTKVITDSYATGSVQGDGTVGGLVGSNGSGALIATSYSTGAVSGQTVVGGLVGGNEGFVLSGYWNTQTSGTSLGVGSGSASGVTGLTDAQMMQRASFVGFDFTRVWRIVEGRSYPTLR